MKVIDQALAVLAGASGANYIGEDVSQLEHALQCAYFATKSGHSIEVVIASLFHDIGHFVSATPQPQMDGLGVLEHEKIGADYLRQCGFPEKVAILVENHVAAKRYLASKNPGYYDKLSEASKGTLAFQGGRMNDSEMTAFEESPNFTESIQVRVNDEKAKVVGLGVPPLEHYRPLVTATLRGVNHDSSL